MQRFVHELGFGPLWEVIDHFIECGCNRVSFALGERVHAVEVSVELEFVQVSAEAEVVQPHVAGGQAGAVRGEPGAVLLGVCGHGMCLLDRVTGTGFVPVPLETPLGIRTSLRQAPRTQDFIFCPRG